MSRINEIITLKKQDLELEHEYPRLYIRNIHSKNKQPLRKRISPEAKRELINYLKQRDRIIQTREKRTPTNRKKHYDPDLLFPTSKQNIEEVWKNLLKKANLYRIDPQTGRPELGTHSLRRYGSQHLGNEDFANFFRGEMTESNRAYFDYPDERLDEEYKKHVKNLFVLQTPEETEYKMELYGQELAEANKKLKEFEGLVSILNKTKIDQIKRIEKLERINLEKERDNIYPERTILKPNENLTNKDRQYEDEIEKQVIQEKRQELKDLIKTDPKNKDSEIVTRNGVPYLQKKNTEIKTINHDLQSLRNELIKERAEYKQLNKEMKTLLKQTKQQLKKKLKKEF